MSQVLSRRKHVVRPLTLIRTLKCTLAVGTCLIYYIVVCSFYAALFFPSSFTENLKSYCSQLPTVIKQLTVISDVQLGATNFDSVSIVVTCDVNPFYKDFIFLTTVCLLSFRFQSVSLHTFVLTLQTFSPYLP